MEWIAVIAAIAAPVLGFAGTWLGQRTRRRLGLPSTPLDEQIQEQEERLRQSLKDAEERCRVDLEEARADLREAEAKAAAHEQRYAALVEEFDDQRLYIGRLEARLNKLEIQRGSPGA